MQKLVDCDIYQDFVLSRAKSPDFDKNVERLLRNEKMDEDLKKLVLYLDYEAKRADSRAKQKEKDDDDDSDENDETDPRYEFFLEHLREHEKFYALEYERNGIPVVLKYAEDSSSDEERNQEPRRKLRSATKQNSAHSSRQMPGMHNQAKNDSLSTSSEETRNLTGTCLRNMAKSEKAQNVKCSTSEMVCEPEYLVFTQNLKIEGDHYVFTCEGHRVVYEENSGVNNQEKKEKHDESSSDVEIIDNISFHEKRNVNPSTMNGDSIVNNTGQTMQAEFRHQVIALLRKPFDKEEYDKLRSDVKLRKLETRHMDLRNGRERSCSTQKIGKSYLDHYPDLRRKLRDFRDDKPKGLNILRGFFFWLQNFLQKGSFRPWEDAECLAINPKSC